jgi:hypothetical protein
MNAIKIKPSKDIPLPKLLQMAQITFNKWIRKRDEGKPCISGGGIAEEAGHCFPAGSFSGVRFDEINVNGQSVEDNRFKGGKREQCLEGIAQRYGMQYAEELVIRARVTKKYSWSREELVKIINKYKS